MSERNDVKVSLILPSLNVGSYIAECLESALHQTLRMRELEIICVDAGSTDGTLETIEEYAKIDSRIQVIKSDQKSYGHQMNLGIRAARGEYIGILETDDIVPPEMYEELYEVASRNRADLVKADFYRFTGSGKEMQKELIRVTGNKQEAYRRVLDVSTQKDCFNFVMNTWSGIYRREFLLENNIWHHESPGAAFQDNGFWFQTFLHAKRACFVNKAYYMNRRDREDSSVFDVKNVFAICEEYDWIEEKLKEDPKLYEEYGSLHAYFCFRNYKWTLDRIRYEDKPEFYRRLREKFLGYQKAGILDFAIFQTFNESLALSLWAILNRPEAYYKTFYQSKKDIIESIPLDRPVIIYGAGGVGKDCRDDFLKMGRKEQVACFAVTQANGTEEAYHDVEVCGIEDMTGQRETATVILAVKPAFREEMMDNLLRLGFQDVRQWPDLEYTLREEFSPSVQQWRGNPEKGYVFPYEAVKKGSRILLCGDGEMAESYTMQMEKTGYAEIVQRTTLTDFNSGEGNLLGSCEEIDRNSFDYAIMAYEDADSARRAGWHLLGQDVPADRLIWYDTEMKDVTEFINRRVHVAYITDDHYVMPTMVSMLSMKRNKDPQSEYRVYVIGSELNSENQSKLLAMSEENFRVDVIDAVLEEEFRTLRKADNDLHVRPAAILKFQLPKLLSGVGKVLYLDGDTLVQGDLCKLYNTELAGRYAAVVKDIISERNPGHMRFLRYANQFYFNSGMMLLNLTKLRRDNIAEKLVDYRRKGINHFMDQDALNVVFRENVIYVSPRYNFLNKFYDWWPRERLSNFYGETFPETFEEAVKNAVILHLGSHEKPWVYDMGFLTELYRKYQQHIEG